MYDKLREIIQKSLDTGVYKMKIVIPAFNTFPDITFVFKVDHFNYVKVHYRASVNFENKYIQVYEPDYIRVRAGFSSELVETQEIFQQSKIMQKLIVDHYLELWAEQRQKKDARLKRIIDTIYNLWKSKTKDEN